MNLVMRPENFESSNDDVMEPDQFPGNQLISYAQQVSFPNWNAMVGNLGEKFARRGSLDKEPINEEKREEVLKSISEFHRAAYLDSTAEMKTQDVYGCNYDVQKGKHNRNATPIYRYCEIIKEDSRESEEPPDIEEKEPAKIHISTVSIMLKNGRGKKNGDMTVKASDKSEEHKEESEKEIDEHSDEEKDDDSDANEKISEKEERKHILERLKSLERNLNIADDAGESQEERNNSSNLKDVDDNFAMTNNKIGDDLTSVHKMRRRLKKRASAIDEIHLSPEYTSNEQKENAHNKSHQKARFRKKSSSFSGALPLHHNTVNDRAPSPVTDRNKRHQRRRGTVDMGKIESQRPGSLVKEKRHRNLERKVDPSHYLMGSSKRRGSYNPTYDQGNFAINKTKKSNGRAKSMFICQIDERVALRERLMKHACPELRESLELDDEEGGENKIENISTETNIRKKTLVRSASYDEHHPVRSTKSLYDINEDENSHRRATRKAAIIPSPPARIEEDDSVFKKQIGINYKKFGDPKGLFNTTQNRRPRFGRANSNFDGLPSMYLGRLREKSVTIEHERLTRSESDSISISSASSEGGEGTDPFPIHTAAKNGKQKQLQKFIANGASVDAHDSEGWPPIHYALSAGHFECVAVLLRAGANISNYTKGRTSKYFR